MGDNGDNPIAARIDRLGDQWTIFVRDANARVLRWVVDEDELPLLEGFFIRESNADASKTPDIFWTSEAPFRDATRHGVDLRTELVATVDGARAELAESGAPPSWRPPPAVPTATDIEVWLATLKSFRDAHPGVEVVGVCLRPSAVADPAQYLEWLRRLARAAPLDVRFVVIDGAWAPALDALAAAEPARVRTQRASLDVPGALAELAASGGQLDMPGGRFRHAYVRMSGAAKAGDSAAVDALGAEALAVSEAQGWLALSCAVHFLQGSLALRAGRPADAFARFMRADDAGARADAAGDRQGKVLRVKARLSAGSALLVANDHPRAAAVFTAAVPFARAADDRRAELDAWRLASYAHGQAGDTGRAWEAGQAGLAVARSMDADTRATSTLKSLGESLVHWAQSHRLADVESTVRRELDALLGPGWASREP